MTLDVEALDSAMNELSAAFEQHTGILALVTGKVAGKDHWAYALIPPQTWPAFLHVQSQGGYDLGDYASEILAQGKGKKPPKTALEGIRQSRLDIDFNFENDFRTLLAVG